MEEGTNLCWYGAAAFFDCMLPAAPLPRGTGPVCSPSRSRLPRPVSWAQAENLAQP